MNNSTQIMKFEDDTLEVIEINQSQLQQVCSLINRSFITFDPIYKKYLTNINQVYEETKYYVQQSIEQNLAFGIRLKPSNKIIGAVLFFDVYSGVQVQLSAPQLQDKSLDKLKEARKMQYQMAANLIGLQDFKKGEAAYGTYLSIDPQFVNYKLGHLCSAIGFRKTFDKKFKKIFVITYNSASSKIVADLGGRVVAKKRDQKQNLDIYLFQQQCTQDKILNKYIQNQQLKTLKQLKKTSIPKSKL